jgi:hypothetical protein
MESFSLGMDTNCLLVNHYTEINPWFHFDVDQLSYKMQTSQQNSITVDNPATTLEANLLSRIQTYYYI